MSRCRLRNLSSFLNVFHLPGPFRAWMIMLLRNFLLFDSSNSFSPPGHTISPRRSLEVYICSPLTIDVLWGLNSPNLISSLWLPKISTASFQLQMCPFSSHFSYNFLLAQIFCLNNCLLNHILSWLEFSSYFMLYRNIGMPQLFFYQ